MSHDPLKLSFKADPFHFSGCEYSLVLPSVFLKYVSYFKSFWPLPPSRHFAVTISTGLNLRLQVTARGWQSFYVPHAGTRETDLPASGVPRL